MRWRALQPMLDVLGRAVRLPLALWRRSPVRIRYNPNGRITRYSLAHRIPDAPKALRLEVGPVRVAGFLSATNGVGQGARLQLARLAKLGLCPVSVDLTADVIPDRRVSVLPTENARATGHGGCIILHANPPTLQDAIASARIGPTVYRIGYWAWELETAPPVWADMARFVHEVWTPSHFSADAIRQRVSIPVHVVPHPLDVPVNDVNDVARSVGTQPFTVLFAYDVRSSHARKNPEAAIAAFRRAFPRDTRARMIIKVSDLQAYPAAENSLARAISGDPRIRLERGVLSDSDMQSLIRSADVILSLHRSEGFGLLLAHGMAAGRVVIATGWSGNTDFMSNDCAIPVPYRLVPVEDAQRLYESGRWAEPDIDAAADALRACYTDASLRRSLGDAAAAAIARQLGPELDACLLARLPLDHLVSGAAHHAVSDPTGSA
jgi:glycosyltransferase involved in cell wall biosynthesis